MTENMFASAEAAAAWRRGADLRNSALGEATGRMLAAAGVGPGSRVLDVGAGTGDTSLIAARLALPGGTVLATDISAPMLEGAVEAARTAGLSNIATLCVNSAELDLDPGSFDAAIARNSLQFVGDVGRALGAIRAALRPAGRFAALVWSSPQDNAYLWIPVAAAERAGLLRVPIDSVMGPFALGDADACLRHLRAAGFEGVSVERIAVERRQPSVPVAVDRHREGALFRTLSAGLSEPEIELLLTEIRLQTEAFAVDGEVRGPGVALLMAGARPAVSDPVG